MNAQQMRENLLPTKEADNGAACMGCMQFEDNLVRCSGCRRVKYCGRECQSKDWKKVRRLSCSIREDEEVVSGISLGPTFF